MMQEHPVDCPRGMDLSGLSLNSDDGLGSMRAAIIAAALFARERSLSSVSPRCVSTISTWACHRALPFTETIRTSPIWACSDTSIH